MFARVIFPLAWGAVVLPALFAASAIAWRLGNGPELGAPLLGDWIYPPWALVRWLGEWDLAHEPTRALFVQGALLAFVPGALATVLLGLRLVAAGKFERARTHDAEKHLGSVRDLKRSGLVTAHGDGIVLGRRSAAWARALHLNGGRLLYWLGVDQGEILRAPGDGHVLVEGYSGSGKTVGPIVGTLIECRAPMIVFDPKRELARITSRHRASLGTTLAFDPTEPFSDHYNPLLELRQGEHLHGDCEIIASLIAHRENVNDPTWQNAAAEMITALMLVAFEQGQPTLAHVHDLVLQVGAQNPPVTGNDYARRVLAAHMGLEDRVRSSVNFETRTAMKFMSDPIVREVTSRSDFRGSDLFCEADPMTVFVQTPPADSERLAALMRVVLQVLFNAGLHHVRTTVDGRPKEWQILALLEEFPELRKMPFLQHQLKICRGFGIRAFLACQDRAQIKEEYGDNESITSNMSTIAVMPGFSDSLEDLEQWAGWEMQATRSRGREMLKPLSVRTGEQEDRRPVLNVAQEIRRNDELLVFTHHAPPTRLERVRYFREPRWKGMWDG